uniref:LIM and SH3 domain protein 1 n=1 Tax=Piliocolobus tephrosceles TaxID=591936 RepID=A0A8C9LQD2_9PRIM
MNPNCARCGKIVYPTEKVNCLDKFWHKACFHCETCKMTLNMKNYKGYEKKPYCNAHYPKQSFTMVADTPENLRLKQQSELQSQVRYKEEFEKNKGKGFSVVADTPELQRIKKTQDQISNIKYHEEFEKSRMGPSGGEGMEPERRDSQESSSYRRPPEQQQPHHIPTSAPVYQQPQQQPVAQSYGGYKEPAAPVSIQRSAPGGGGKRYRAVYDYSAADEDEVSFQDGDTIINVQQIDDGWMGNNRRMGFLLRGALIPSPRVPSHTVILPSCPRIPAAGKELPRKHRLGQVLAFRNFRDSYRKEGNQELSPAAPFPTIGVRWLLLPAPHGKMSQSLPWPPLPSPMPSGLGAAQSQQGSLNLQDLVCGGRSIERRDCHTGAE